jgi:Putative Flp pilus-assembly TadE/G-like
METGTHHRNRRNGERGSMLLLGALTIAVLMAFAGLALDATYMYFHKRTMQTAADAGAYAGALEKLRGNTDIVTAVDKDTALNGFTNASRNVTVTVNNPPLSGSKAGDSNYIEVIIAHPQPTWFMRVLHFDSVNVKARAVAGVSNTGNGCVYALNQDTSNQNNGFFVNGTTNSTFSCGVYSNANFRSVGGACVVTPTVSYSGTYTNQNGGTCGPTGIGKGVPVDDPLAGKYSIPSYSSCTATNFRVTTGTTVHIPPGTYCGGITITGTIQNVVFDSGSYILVGGGLQINGGVNVTGAGVTFFNTYPGTLTNKYGAIDIEGTGTVNLSAPTSGPYAGLLFYQDPSVPWSASNGSIIAGGASSTYDGILYFPTTDLQYAGNSSSQADGSGYTILVGYNIMVNGTAQINADYSALGGKSPLQNAVFAE